jgi:aryl-alcohol dehydrogenase-like predicted oxidoreductase
METIPLGKTDIRISRIGLGSWAWGDRIFWAYGVTHSHEDVEAALKTSLEAGINFIDTAEVYGFGATEKLLGRLLRNAESNVILASKLFPYPWRLSTRSLIRGLKGSLRRLGLEAIDLYMMHWPLPPIRVERWTTSLIHAYQEGLIKAIGVSNYTLSQMRRTQDVLDQHGLSLSANQVHFSLLHQEPDKSGLMTACARDEVTVMAYSPLGQGLLTGKYAPDSSMPKGMMRLGNRKIITNLQPLIALMREIGANYGGKSPAQIAINWAICKGAVPIVGAKNQRQAAENAASTGWSLSKDDLDRLQVASEPIQLSFPMGLIARA